MQINVVSVKYPIAFTYHGEIDHKLPRNSLIGCKNTRKLIIVLNQYIKLLFQYSFHMLIDCSVIEHIFDILNT